MLEDLQLTLMKDDEVQIVSDAHSLPKAFPRFACEHIKQKHDKVRIERQQARNCIVQSIHVK